MHFTKKIILTIIFLFTFSVSSSQTTSDSLRGEFTYLLQCKPIIQNKDYIYKELFSLQISDKRAFFVSENRLKFDSIVMGELNKNRNNFNIDLRGIPSSRFNFLIIQSNDYSQLYQKLGMTLLSYNTPVIDHWKLIDETKVINSIICKKAEVHYRGRDWTAWYSTEIPFPYGPYKFSGLPGLIVKITDKTGDYDFELVKSVQSSKLKGNIITINKRHYQNPKSVTEKELNEARANLRQNAKHELENMGTVFFDDQKERKKTNEKIEYNSIELES